MSERIYPKDFMKNTLAEERVMELKRDIKEITAEIATLFDKISLKAGEIEEICPHLKTKTEHEHNEGGYLNRGSHIEKEICVLCGEEMDRTETDTGYA